MDRTAIARELVRLAKSLTIEASSSRHCLFYLAADEQWYMELASEEYEGQDRADTYGPFVSFDAAYDYLDNFSNPGSFYTDKSGKRPAPKRSPNGRPIQEPRRNRGW